MIQNNNVLILLILIIFLTHGCDTGEPLAFPEEKELLREPELCASGEAAVLTKVIDGDTIDVRFPDGNEERVRYIGIDTDEIDGPCYAEANARNSELLGTGQLRLIKDVSERDIYGRLVRYICNEDDVLLDAQLVWDGVARAYPFKPDTRFADYFESLEQEAAEASRGCLNRAALDDSEAIETSCCRVCRNGLACGDSCIPSNQVCRSSSGCACQG